MHHSLAMPRFLPVALAATLLASTGHGTAAPQDEQEIPEWICLDKEVPRSERRARWANHGNRIGFGRLEATSALSRLAIEEAVEGGDISMATRRLSKSRLTASDLRRLLEAGPPDELVPLIQDELARAEKREVRALERKRKVVEKNGPAPGLVLPDHLEPAWHEPGSYKGLYWFDEAQVLLALRLEGQCDVFDRDGQRVGAFIAEPGLETAFRMVPAMLADEYGDPVPGVIIVNFEGRIVGLDLTGLPLWATSVETMVMDMATADADDDGFSEILVNLSPGRKSLCLGAGGEQLWERAGRMPAYGICGGDFHEQAGTEFAVLGHRSIEILGRRGEVVETWPARESFLRPNVERRLFGLDALVAVSKEQVLRRASATLKPGESEVATLGLEALVQAAGGPGVDRKGRERKILSRIVMADGCGLAFYGESAQLILDGEPFPMESSVTKVSGEYVMIPALEDGEDPLLVAGFYDGASGLTAVPLWALEEAR